MIKFKIFFVLSLLILANIAQATTFHVPGNYGSISSAMSALDDDPSTVDSIIVSTSISFLIHSPVTFKSGVVLINTTDDIITLQGDGVSNIFEFSDPNANTYVDGFKFDNAYDHTSTGGGCIRVNTSTTSALNVIDCSFTGSINDAGGNGSSVRIYGSGISNCTFNNCRFTSNTTTGNGGSVSIETTTSNDNFNDCIFLQNYTDGSNSDGGALFVNSTTSTVDLEGCTFSSNYTNGTTSHGGSIYISADYTGTINDCDFISNHTTTADSHGGAAYIYQSNTASTYYVTNSSFSSNEASSTGSSPAGDGGAMYLTGAGVAPNRITDCVFTSNTANSSSGVQTYGGGALWIAGSGKTDVLRCTFTTNIVDGTSTKYKGGGAIWFTGSTSTNTFEVDNCVFDRNGIANISSDASIYPHQNGGAVGAPLGCDIAADSDTLLGNYAGHGGGFNIDEGTLTTYTNLYSAYNSAYTGGSIAMDHSTTVVTDSYFEGDSALVSGGAIMFPDVSKFTFTGNTFYACKADSFGGAIDLGSYSNALCSINDCFFDSCYVKYTSATTEHGCGGAIGDATYAASNGSVDYTSCRFNDCFAPKNGGAIFSMQDATDDCLVESCVFQDCVATSGSGGGIYFVEGSYAYDSSSFIGCMAGTNGGALYITSSYAASTDSSYVSHCTFKNNSATQSGGAIYLASGPMDYFYSLFSGNTSGGSYYGGAIYQGPVFNSIDPDISSSYQNCTFAANSRAAVYNSGLSQQTNTSVSSSIYYANTGLGAFNFTSNSTVSVINFTGFELGDYTKEFVTSSGTLSSNSSVVYTGTYSLRTNPATLSTGYVNFKDPLNANFNVSTLYGSIRFRYTTKPGGNSEPILAFTGTSFPAKCEIRINSSGNLELYNNAGTLAYTGTNVLYANKWYLIEWSLAAGTSASCTIRVNGTTDISGTTNTLTDNYASINVGKSANRNGQTVDFYFDDLSVSSAGYTNGARVKLVVPTADGTYKTWTNGFANVDEIPVSDGDLITDATLNDIESYTMASCGISSTSSIYAYKNMIRLQKSGVTAPSVGLFTRTHSTDYVSAGITAPNSWAPEAIVYSDNPNTSSDWTVSEVNAVEIGVKHLGASPNVAQVSCVDGYILYEDVFGSYSCSDSYANTGGNTNSPVSTGTNCFSSDPKFCNSTNYLLQSVSPCIAPSGCSGTLGYSSLICSISTKGIGDSNTNRNGFNVIKNGISE